MKPMQSVGCRPAILAFFLLLLLPCSLHAAPVPITDYLQLQPGNSWTYLQNGSTPVTQTVLQGTELVNGVSTIVMLQTGGEESGTRVNYSITADGFKEHRESNPNAFIPGPANLVVESS